MIVAQRLQQAERADIRHVHGIFWRIERNADVGLSGQIEDFIRRDARDDRLKLLDVNARAWGWHSIGAATGVDFAYLAWRIACGEPVEPMQGRSGVRWARLTTDVMAAAPELLAGRMPVGPYLRSLRRPLVGPIAAKDDPVPALLELPLLGARFVRRARRQLEFTKKSSRATRAMTWLGGRL